MGKHPKSGRQSEKAINGVEISIFSVSSIKRRSWGQNEPQINAEHKLHGRNWLKRSSQVPNSAQDTPARSLLRAKG